jgi:hypothetical protein
MKKVSLILLLVIFASVALMAASPLKLVRLTFINKSGHTIYVKLEGKSEGNFYYLTIPEGTKEIPEEVTFTVVQDIYSRTMWYGPGGDCEGGSNDGELWAIKHSKFVFTPCGQRVWTNGEPSWGEKIVYFKYIDAYALNVIGGGCYWTVKSSTYKSPTGSCFFLWKY